MNVLKRTDQIAPMVQPVLTHGAVRNVFALEIAMDRRANIVSTDVLQGTQRQFSEKFCSEDDLRSRIFETFVVKFLACLPLLGFSNI